MSIEQRIIGLLSKVLTGEITPEEALDSWPSEQGPGEKPIRKGHSRLLGNAWHTLYHYSIDDDIRAKDASYGDRERRGIEEIIVALQEIDDSQS